MFGVGYNPAFEDGWKEVDAAGCLEDGAEEVRSALLILSSPGSFVNLEMEVEPGGEVVIFVLRAVDGVPPFW